MLRSSQARFDGLQLLRGVAAISVLGYHGATIERESGAGFETVLGFFDYFGYVGVDLFFILSGFIIAWTSKNYSSGLRGMVDYAGERLSRIFPIFWMAWLLSALIYYVMLKQSYCHPGDVVGSVSLSLSLLRPQSHCIVPQAWTLSWELLFYFVVGALLPLFLRHKLWVASVWAALVAANLAFDFTRMMVLSYFCLYFIVGIAIAWLIERKLIFAPRAFIAVGAAWLLGAALANWRFGIDADDLLARMLGLGLGASILIYGVVGLEASRGLKVSPLLSFFGDASYSIYLFHVTALLLMSRLYVGIESAALHYAWVFGLLAIPLALSAGLYLIAEKPMMKRFRSHRNGEAKIAIVCGLGLLVFLAAPLLVNSAPNARISSYQAAAGPVDLLDAIADSDRKTHLVQVAQVDAIARLMACSLDSVNGLTPRAASIDTSSVMALSGWSQYAAGDASMTVVLRGVRTYAFRARVGQARPDLAVATKSLEPISDILASSDLQGIAAGKYTVLFVRNGDRGLAKCVASKEIEVV